MKLIFELGLALIASTESFVCTVLLALFSNLGKAVVATLALVAIGTSAEWSWLEFIFSGCALGAIFWITLAYPEVRKLKYLDATWRDVLIVWLGIALALAMMGLSILLLPTVPAVIMFLANNDIEKALLGTLNKYVPIEEEEPTGM